MATSTHRARGRRAQPRPATKAEHVLRAAADLFSRYGYRRTSVDLIASEAGVAKPTVYAHFANKEALFRAVCGHVMDTVLADARRAIEGPGPVQQRLTRALAAKFSRLFGLVHQSPHAAELIDSQGRLGADLVDRADDAFRQLLVAAIERATAAGELDPARAGLSAGALADLLQRCGHGAGYRAADAREHQRHLAALVRAVLAGVRG